MQTVLTSPPIYFVFAGCDPTALTTAPPAPAVIDGTNDDTFNASIERCKVGMSAIEKMRFEVALRLFAASFRDPADPGAKPGSSVRSLRDYLHGRDAVEVSSIGCTTAIMNVVAAESYVADFEIDGKDINRLLTTLRAKLGAVSPDADEAATIASEIADAERRLSESRVALHETRERLAKENAVFDLFLDHKRHLKFDASVLPKCCQG
jgi:hypothetical protein